MEVVVINEAMQVVIQPYVVLQRVVRKVDFASLPYFKKVVNIVNVNVYEQDFKVDFRNNFVHEEVTNFLQEDVIEIVKVIDYNV